MNTYVLDNLLNKQMSREQIEVLEEFLSVLDKMNYVARDDAFIAEASNHHIFDVCYKEDTSRLVERVEKLFPNLEGYIEQLSCEDYVTDHDKFNSREEEWEAKRTLINKISEWEDSVDLFIENLCEMY